MFPTGRNDAGYGRIVMTPGHHRRTPMPRVVNIDVNKTYNIFPQGGFATHHSHGCNGGGLGGWGIASMILGLGGGILSSLFGNNADLAVNDDTGGGDKTETPEKKTGTTPEPTSAEIDTLKEENKKLQKKLDELNATIEAAKKRPGGADGANGTGGGANGPEGAGGNGNTGGGNGVDGANGSGKTDNGNGTGKDPTVGARQLQGGTTSFTVQAKKLENGQYEGHTGYNIVAGMYQTQDGKKLNSTDILAICDKLFGGKALATGNLELPNTIEINGKTYQINPDAKAEDVQKTTYGLADIAVHQSGARQEGGKWVGTIDGKDIAGQYDTEEEAIAAAKAKVEADKKQAES